MKKNVFAIIIMIALFGISCGKSSKDEIAVVNVRDSIKKYMSNKLATPGEIKFQFYCLLKEAKKTGCDFKIRGDAEFLKDLKITLNDELSLEATKMDDSLNTIEIVYQGLPRIIDAVGGKICSDFGVIMSVSLKDRCVFGNRTWEALDCVCFWDKSSTRDNTFKIGDPKLLQVNKAYLAILRYMTEQVKRGNLKKL